MTSWTKKLILLCLAGALCACSNGNGSSATALVDSNGKHAANWLDQHWIVAANLKGLQPSGAEAAVNSTATPCAQCHGKDLLGGISKVSCFSTQLANGMQCHPDRIGHPTGWANPMWHGQLGAMATAGVSTGFAYCAKCHGANLQGGAGKAVSCLSCHTKAPHPSAPWIGGSVSHATTGASNSAVCAQCHTGGANYGPVLVSTPAQASPAAPAPDCFNNTLCHGGQVNPPHETGTVYLLPSHHGPDATGNSVAHPEIGLATCQSCHADATGRFNLRTVNMASGCETCHKSGTAHPTPWLSGRAVTGATPANADNTNTTSHSSIAPGHVTTDCSPCHGAALDATGNKFGAPSCMSASRIAGVSCHATSIVATPSGCNSCHNGFVGNHPATNAHAKHLALPNISCDACHAGGGADPVTRKGYARHADGFLDISSVTFWGRNGGFRYDRGATLTCANVRCHGGQTTPAWNSSNTIDVTTDCLKCHQQGDAGNTPQTPQYNSFYSGLSALDGTTNLHQFHLNPANYGVFPNLATVTCRSCHSLTTAQHFSGLASVGFTKPGDTVSFAGGTYLKDVNGNYPGTCSNVSCHSVVSKTATWGK